MFFPAVIPSRRLVGQRPQKSRIAFSPGKPAFLPGFQYIRNKKIIRFTGIGYQCKQHIARRHQKVIPHAVSFRQKSRLFRPKRRLSSRFHSCLSLGYAVTGDPAGHLTPMLCGRTSPRRAQSPSSQRGFSLGRAGKRLLFPRHRINYDLNLSLVYHIMRESQATSPLMLLQRTSPPMSPPCQAAALPCSDAGTGTASSPH